MVDVIKVIKGVESIVYGGNMLGGVVLVEFGDIKNDLYLYGVMQYVFEINGWGYILNI